MAINLNSWTFNLNTARLAWNRGNAARLAWKRIKVLSPDYNLRQGITSPPSQELQMKREQVFLRFIHGDIDNNIMSSLFAF